MARDGTFGNSNHISNTTSVPVTGTPYTHCIWFYKRNSDFQDAFGMGDSGNTSWVSLGYFASPHQQFRCQIRDGGASIQLVGGATSPSNGFWYHLGCVHAADNDHELYIDGSSAGTSSVTATTTNWDSFWMGYRVPANNNPIRDSDIAEAAVWNAALDADEMAALGKGFSPLLIRPQSLVAYWPLGGRRSPEPDIVGGHDGTIVGTLSHTDHPKIYRPTHARQLYQIRKAHISVPVKSFVRVGFAPTVTAVEDTVIAAPSRAFATAGQASAVSTGGNVVSPTGSITLSGVGPAVGTSVSIASLAGAFTLSGFVPAVASGVSVTAPLQAFVRSGQAPTVGTSASVAPPAMVYSLTGIAPLRGSGVRARVPLKQFLLSGLAPSVLARAWTRVTLVSMTWTKVIPTSTNWTKVN